VPVLPFYPCSGLESVVVPVTGISYFLKKPNVPAGYFLGVLDVHFSGVVFFLIVSRRTEMIKAYPVIFHDNA
jgi:hypothetical protein